MGLRHTPDLIIAILTCAGAWGLWRGSESFSGRIRRLALAVSVLGVTASALGLLLSFIRFARMLSPEAYATARAISILLSGFVLYCGILAMLFRKGVRFAPERRKLLQHVAQASLVAPVALVGAAYIRRNHLTYREIQVTIPNLPKELEGFRIVQLSDLHLSPLVSEKLVARAVDMANGTNPNLAVVTGDLISVAGDPLDACLHQLSRLRASQGILGCMGNHEEYAQSQEYTATEGARMGIRFLRQEAVSLRFGAARLNIAGVDYQSRKKKYLVGAAKLVEPGAVNLLLSHNPDVFPVAASQGFDLTLAGHTHGGQVNFEILHQNVNIVRLLTPYVYGLYELGDRSIYVTRGIGTIGVPLRLGAPPEVALIRLCGTSS